MLSKLIYGQYSLKETFWKFGVLGVFLCSFVTRCFHAFLSSKLNGLSLRVYYTQYFSPLHMDNGILFLTLAFFVCAFVMSVYSLMVFSGVWRSAKAYNKSAWLSFIARLCTLAVIYGAFKFAL